MWALVLVGVARDFGTIGHVQQCVSSVRKMEKYMLKEQGYEHGYSLSLLH